MNKLHFLELKIPPPVILFIFGGIMWLTALGFPSASVSLPARHILALVISAGAAAIAGAGILSFLRARTTLNPHSPQSTSRLIVNGIYALTRNPMYLSLLLLLIAWGTYLANIAAFVPILFFIAYVNRFQIKPEERVLASLFGSTYESYCKRVRRWL